MGLCLPKGVQYSRRVLKKHQGNELQVQTQLTLGGILNTLLWNDSMVRAWIINGDNFVKSNPFEPKCTFTPAVTDLFFYDQKDTPRKSLDLVFLTGRTVIFRMYF